MRDNLLFSNIPERPNETPETTEAVLRDFLVQSVKMEQEQVDNLKFDRVHRMAGHKNPRLIVAKFNDFKQRQDVKRRSGNLRGTNYYINEQYPAEVNEQRKELIRVMKEKRRQGHRTKLVYNKLYVDGVLYNSTSKPNDRNN